MSTAMLVTYSTRKLLEQLVSNSSFSASFGPNSLMSLAQNTSNSSYLVPATGVGGLDGSDSNDNPYSLSTRFNPSMAIIIVVLLSAFFFMGFFSVYVRRCSTDEESNQNNSRSPDPRRYEGLQQGLDGSIVESFPMVTYSAVKNLKTEKESTECVVCLNEFEENETLKLLPKCGHTFHEECIDMWLFSHTTCPLCRQCLLHDRGSFRGLAESFRRLLAATLADERAPVRDQAGALASGSEAAVSIADDPECAARDGDGIQETVDVPVRSVVQNGSPRSGSPIYGVVGTPPCSKCQSSRGQRLRRSRSTGHSPFKSPRNQSPSEGSSSQPFPFHLKLIGCDFRRSRSFTNVSDEWREGRDLLGTQRSDTDRNDSKGWRSFTIRRPFNMKRFAADDRHASTSMLESSPEAIKPTLTSVRRTFKRLAGMEKRQDSTTQASPNQDN